MSRDELAQLGATLADLSTTLRAAARAAGQASAALWGIYASTPDEVDGGQP